MESDFSPPRCWRWLREVPEATLTLTTSPAFAHVSVAGGAAVAAIAGGTYLLTRPEPRRAGVQLTLELPM